MPRSIRQACPGASIRFLTDTPLFCSAGAKHNHCVSLCDLLVEDGAERSLEKICELSVLSELSGAYGSRLSCVITR